jgi:hypothetical protein
MRYQISFNRDDPRHVQAEGFLFQHSKQRSEYIVSCILKAEEANLLKKTIAEAVKDAFSNISTVPKPTQQQPPQTKADAISLNDLPNSLLDFADSF